MEDVSRTINRLFVAGCLEGQRLAAFHSALASSSAIATSLRTSDELFRALIESRLPSCAGDAATIERRIELISGH